MQKQQFTGQIKITVYSPELIGGASKHHSYRIHGSDDIGEIDVWRRYSDFVIFKQHMVNRWPGIYVPSLPEKKFLGNNQADFLIIRRQGLQKFLNQIANEKYLWYSDEFQLFIKSKTAQVDKSLSNLGKTNNRQIAAKYRTKFASIMQTSDSDKSYKQYDVKVAEFRAYLKNTHMILQKMAKVSDVMAESRKRFNDRYEHLLTNILPGYEEKCTTQYTDDQQNLFFFNSKTNGLAEVQVNLSLATKQNSLIIVNELIKQQLREISNFQQILKIRQEFETAKLKALAKTKDLQLEQSRINVGKESLLNKIKNASREQQLQQNKIQLTKSRQDFKDAEEVCKVIDTMLAIDQIPRFKTIRTKNYYQIVREMAKAEKKNLQIQQQYWSKISGDRFQVSEIAMEKSQPTQITKIGNIQVIHHQNEHQQPSQKQQAKKVEQQEPPKEHEQEHQQSHEPSTQALNQNKQRKISIDDEP